jgi:hypothetical protein
MHKTKEQIQWNKNLRQITLNKKKMIENKAIELRGENKEEDFKILLDRWAKLAKVHKAQTRWKINN